MTEKLAAINPLSLIVRFVLLTGILLAITVHIYFAASNPHEGYHFSDAVRYLFFADWFGGATDEVTEAVVEQNFYPPLFPLYLYLAGAGADSIVTAHLATVASLILACIAFLWWLKVEKFAFNDSLLIVLLFLILPGIFLHTLKVSSEYLFLCLVLCALTALIKGESDKRWILFAAVLVGLSILTRTVGIALLPGLLWATRRLDPKKAVLCFLLAVGPHFAWHQLVPGANQGENYTHFLLHFLSNNSILGIFNFMASQLERLFFSWVQIFDRWMSPHVIAVQAIVLLISCVGFLKRLIGLKPDALFLLFYSGIILIWPYPLEAERFLLVLIPFLLFNCFQTVIWLASQGQTKLMGRSLQIVVPLSLAISLLPTLVFYFDRYKEPVSEEILQMKYSPGWYSSLNTENTVIWATKLSRIYHLLDEVSLHVAEGECVYAIAFEVVVLYTGRESVRLPVDMYDQLAIGKEYDLNSLNQCNYILFLNDSVKQVPQYVPMYPILVVQSQVKPILVSSMVIEDDEQIVAALAEIVR